MEKLTQDIINGYDITPEEAYELEHADLGILSDAADKIRRCAKSVKSAHSDDNTGDYFDLCSVISGKGGACTENCKFCSQGRCNKEKINVFPLKSEEGMFEEAVEHEKNGVYRFCIVTAGRSVSKDELSHICSCIGRIKKETKLHVCVSLGLLSGEALESLKNAGVERVHCNLETSEKHFPNVCTSHTYSDKTEMLIRIKKHGLEICSGGILGIGESYRDRIDMAFELKKYGADSVPINILNPVKGTPFEDAKVPSEEEVRRTIAAYRFILPRVQLRLAAGRGYLPDKGEKIFMSGADAGITGKMLTVGGIGYETDKAMLKRLGYKTDMAG